MNKKGYTMVELLGAIVILGILTSAAIASYTQYKEIAAKKAYKALQSSSASAAENYFMDFPGTTTVTIDDLLEQDYLDSIADPWDKEGKCSGTVEKKLENKEEQDALEFYSYTVQVTCSKGCKCLKFPYKTPCKCPNQ